jgi:hypothetical protein
LILTAGEENVRRLQIPMDNALLVGIVDCAGQRFHKESGSPGRLGCAAQPTSQIAT